MNSVERLISIVKDLEECWKKIKERFNLKNVECCVILKLEKDMITLR